MENIVIYGTTYGSTEKYAKEISRRIRCSSVDSKKVDVKDLEEYDSIILGSCLLEGQILEAGLYQYWIESFPDKNWIIFTVGLSNPSLTDFGNVIRSNFNTNVIPKIKFFHFRGIISHKHLSLMDNLVTSAEYHKIPSIDLVDLKAEDLALLDKYGTTFDIRDTKSIFPLIQYIEQLGK